MTMKCEKPEKENKVWIGKVSRLEAAQWYWLFGSFKMYRSADSVVMNDQQNVVSYVPVLARIKTSNSTSWIEIETGNTSYIGHKFGIFKK